MGSTGSTLATSIGPETLSQGGVATSGVGLAVQRAYQVHEGGQSSTKSSGFRKTSQELDLSVQEGAAMLLGSQRRSLECRDATAWPSTSFPPPLLPRMRSNTSIASPIKNSMKARSKLSHASVSSPNDHGIMQVSQAMALGAAATSGASNLNRSACVGKGETAALQAEQGSKGLSEDPCSQQLTSSSSSIYHITQAGEGAVMGGQVAHEMDELHQGWLCMSAPSSNKYQDSYLHKDELVQPSAFLDLGSSDCPGWKSSANGTQTEQHSKLMHDANPQLQCRTYCDAMPAHRKALLDGPSCVHVHEHYSSSSRVQASSSKKPAGWPGTGSAFKHSSPESPQSHALCKQAGTSYTCDGRLGSSSLLPYESRQEQRSVTGRRTHVSSTGALSHYRPMRNSSADWLEVLCSQQGDGTLTGGPQSSPAAQVRTAYSLTELEALQMAMELETQLQGTL